MAALLGQVNAFNPAVEDWPQYVERLEHYLKANGITGDANAAKRCSVFLSVIGPAPYQLLRSLLAPVKPTGKTFDELAAVLKQHYNPRPSEVSLQFSFSQARRVSDLICCRSSMSIWVL